jgi:hypothetical protein
MQKHAIRAGWRFAAGGGLAAALTLLISVAGLQFSAGMMASSGPVIGDEPTDGLQGAADGVTFNDAQGPVER